MPFYVLTKPEHGSHWDTEYMHEDEFRVGDAPRCVACGSYTGMKEWLPPYRVTVRAHGKAFGDFAFFSTSDFLMSSHAADSWRASGLRGIGEYRPVVVVSHRPAALPPPAYNRPILDQSTTAIDTEQTIVKSGTEISCRVCLSRDLDAVGAIAIDASTWNGEDIFTPRGLPGFVIVSDRFKQFVANAELTNVRLLRVDQHRWDDLDLL
jgi:hypothetical protein